MLDFEDVIRKVKIRCDTSLKLSFQMEAELVQILKYLHVNGVDGEAFFSAFMDKYDPEGVSLNKNETKKFLGDFREYVIAETYISAAKSADEEREKLEGSKNRAIKAAGRIVAWVEEDIADDPLAQKLLENADEIRKIHHYKDVFNTGTHDFKAEKKSGSFIVAKNRDTLVYPGAPFCQNFGNEHFYYTSCVKNCVYDCDYCFLQGLYPCGYPVYFINLEDYFEELDRLLEKFPVYLCISYDTDLLAWEPRLHYVEKWISYAQQRTGLKIEIRTKSGNQTVFKEFESLKKFTGTEDFYNVIFAWTISPEEVERVAETGLPTADKRLGALKAAHAAGFPVRLCFDPMIYHKEWKNSYGNLFKTVFDCVSAEDIMDASLGVFRISNKLLRRMRDANEESPITQFPYITENGACHYGALSDEMIGFARKELMKYLPKEKIFVWNGN